jgi:hypothetical protein
MRCRYSSVYLLYWYKSTNTELVRLDAVQASSDLYKGLWVVALQLQVLLSLLALLAQKYKY